jgi:predicted nucleotidyltransferase
LWDFARLQGEAAQLFGRPVDLVVERALRNPFRRREILRTRRSVYAA